MIGLLLASGCATPQTDRALEGWPSSRPATRRLDVTFHAQQSQHCGPASLAMVLGWSGDPVEPDDLASWVYTPGRDGSLPPDIISAARRRGRLPYPVTDLESLLLEVAGGHPVLVLQNLGLRALPVWHFAVAIGYDLPRGTLILHSGRQAGRSVPLRTFERTWSRAGYWGILVLRPGDMPATAVEAAYLDAALGLEGVGRRAETATAYLAATRRWPGSLRAWMGLGNAWLALGRLAPAEAAFRQAVGARPDSGEALNNLAHVLLERGDLDGALEAIHRALELGGRLRPVFERTLKEIRRAAE